MSAIDTHLTIDTATSQTASAASSSRPSPVSGLTTFPNPFNDEPEPGLLPSFLSKVKQTFSSTTTAAPAAKDKAGPSITDGPPVQTEAQAIAEAARKQASLAAAAAAASASPTGQVAASQTGAQLGQAGPSQPTGKRTGGSSVLSIATPSGEVPPAPLLSPTAPPTLPVPSRTSVATATPPTATSSQAPSVSSLSSAAGSGVAPRRHLVPGERVWRPAGAAPAQVTLSPVTSMTTTMPARIDSNGTGGSGGHGHSGGGAGLGPPPLRLVTHTSIPSIDVTAASAPSSTISRGKPISGRLRRGSIGTIPDSPSSVSLSAMISASAELAQNNYSFVPGFQLPAEDTRSVRSLGFTKRPGSVSKIIRRMRGEGLSKHYWMSDDNCKECYDCKSAFTTWRRKHHCRICGQIFCGRCASNIIGARRFGQEGMVRVCNLCLKIMEDYDDDDDRRSVNSAMSNLPDRVISPEMPFSASPYAASQLFTRHANESLSAIDESAVSQYWNRGGGVIGDRPDLPERPYTPEDPSDMSDSEEGHMWPSTRPSTCAPFRRMHGDDNSDEAPHSLVHSQTPSPGGGPESGSGGRRVGFPSDMPHTMFPRTDTIDSDDGRVLNESIHQHLTMGLRDRISSRASLRGLHALLDADRNDGLWRARSHSFFTKQEGLAPPSLAHFSTMLQQGIQQSSIPNAPQWNKVLSKLLLRVSINLRPVVRDGDSIDVRTYVKIKKVPGGKINDSEYVDGIVITKNVAHKGMARRLVNPRIMVVTFPLDYHRVETQFMSLDPIMKQERDYLRLLTKRIIDLRPHIVLVEKMVSRIALDFLHEANIVVARGVKFSAIHQVARCTHADIIGSMDRLALEPRLGRCANFRIQTFEHDLIPGRRKTYMRFEGTHNGFGGTIILRGGDLATLTEVKVIADFMALVAYHLKNEALLYRDEFNLIPTAPPLPEEYQEMLKMLSEGDANQDKPFGAKGDNNEDATPKPLESDVENEQVQYDAIALSRQIAESLEPYLTTVLAASVAVRFPPPAALAKMASLDRTLAELRRNKEEYEAAQILLEEKQSAPPPPPTPSPAEPAKLVVELVENGDVVTPPATSPPLPDADTATSSETASQVSASEPATPGPTPVPTPPPPPVIAPVAQTAAAVSRALTIAASAPPPSSQLVPSKATAGDPYRVLLNPDDFKEASRLAFVEHEHAEQVKVWKHYLKRHPTPLYPKDYQGIVYLQSLYRQGQDKPCTDPMRHQINFYQDDDQTLGQFLSAMVSNAAHRCPNKNCDQLMLFHYDVLVHAERRLQIVMEQFMCPLPGHEEQILTWSYCRQCNKSWDPIIIHEETWRMSWGAYLEHAFYPPKMSSGLGCEHDAYRDHIRYFAHLNMVIRIHNDGVELFEPIRPSTKLMVRAEDKVKLKNMEYESALHKNAAFFDSVLFRLRSYTDDLVDPEKLSQLHVDRDARLTRAVNDRDEMVNALNRTYKQTPPTDVLAINVVLQALQDKVIQWDNDFMEIERQYMPSEKDLKRMTQTQLRRLIPSQDPGLDKNMANLPVPEVDELEKSDKSSDSKLPSPTLTESHEATMLLPDTNIISTDSPMSLDDQPNPLDVSPLRLEGVEASQESITPTPTLSRTTNNLMSMPDVPRDYDSDSTISAIPGRSIPKTYTAADLASSGVDSDTHGFVSRLPRRTRPAPSVADLVKRFQDSLGNQQFEPIPNEEIPSSLERPRSSGARSRQRVEPTDISDSDFGQPIRPRLRRGREQPPKHHRPETRQTLLSEGERSYAVGASRVVSTRRSNTVGGEPSSSRGSGRISRAASPTPSHRSRDGLLAAPSPRMTLTKAASHEGKPRIAGKGRTPRKPTDIMPIGQPSPGGGLIRGLPRRVIGAGSRVTSIARHFDKISREAERDRQKRISIARGKRAGRVGITKAKVQIFNNVRDAFKDEFDSDSSAADNEEDEGDASDGSVDSTGRARSHRKATSPSVKSAPLPKNEDGETASIAPTEPEPEPESSTRLASTPEEQPVSDHPPPSSVLSDSATDMAKRKERLRIELAPFDTNAPLPPMTPQPHVHALTDTQDEVPGKGFSQLSQMSESEMSSGGGERSSILKTLTNLWAFRAGDFTSLEYPLSAGEHMFTDSRVIVRENEPTSIIAFTLSSKQYREQMRSIAAAAKARRREPSGLEDVSMTSDRQWDIISMDEAVEADDPNRPSEVGTHLKYDFESGSSIISCRIFFAEQFAALRQAYQCEDIFVESLARCAKFDASGGKSGSAFLKTKDDRFIVKEISRLEMDAITKFAPAYFEYTTAAHRRGRPTALAKTYGFFKIGYRNGVTGRSMHMNVLVQENLFYSRTFAKIYDLKGSQRNRLIKPTGKMNEVLLDENLMETAYTNPLYLRDHSKRILSAALWNDTLFLNELNVMDYSLVVGVDTEHNELVVGVVDYIRTFTWDKKVESWVKDLGGGGRGEPTIVTPAQYRKRFRMAIDRLYFPSVPDRWDMIPNDDPLAEEELAWFA